MIFLWLIVGYGIYYLFENGGRADFNRHNNKNSVEVLRQRYANGEIDDETYKRMLKVLNN
jgi:uncharacterized membrane protein